MSIPLKIFILLVVVFSLITGFVLAPQVTVRYDPAQVSGVDYGLEHGEFILMQQRVKISRAFPAPQVSFIQEPDGTVHLYSQKSAAETVQIIQKNQTSVFYTLKVLLFKAKYYAHLYLAQLASFIKSYRAEQKTEGAEH